MRCAVATNCTNRKRFRPIRALQGKHLPKNVAAELAEEWAQRVRNAPPVTTAGELYQGRAFAEARNAAASLRGDLYVISAGLGMVHSECDVPSYNLTITGDSPDNILRRCKDVTSPDEWWRFVNASFQAESLAVRIAHSTHDYWLIAIPTSYYWMVRNDLGTLAPKDLGRVRLFGPRGDIASDLLLQKTLISVDDRLDGPDSDVRGTRGDFPQRAMWFFINHVLIQAPTGDMTSHRNATAKLLSKMKWPKPIPKRTPATDEQICRKLDQFWRKANGRSSKLLRILRDDLQIACEQNRFRGLYHLVAKRRGIE